MTTIIGKAVFTCPIDNKQVTLDQNCINCKYFQHHGYKGAKPYISCKAKKQ